MLPLARPTTSMPKPGKPLFVAAFLPLMEGRGRGGKQSAVTAEGVKSTKRHRCTASVDVPSTMAIARHPATSEQIDRSSQHRAAGKSKSTLRELQRTVADSIDALVTGKLFLSQFGRRNDAPPRRVCACPATTSTPDSAPFAVSFSKHYTLPHHQHQNLPECLSSVVAPGPPQAALTRTV